MQTELIESFQNFKVELQSFIFRLLTNKQDAEDIVQETYLKVHQNIQSFRGESTFKTWVFAIALNLSKNHLAKQKRWLENAQDYGAALHMKSMEHWLSFNHVFETTPDKQYEVKEHIVYCFNCINKTLELNQQVCLLLKEVYEFKISEIMEITHLSEGIVKHAIADARKNMVRIFDDRCAFVNKKGVCHQCTALTGLLNPKQNAQMEALKIKMVKEGNDPDKEHLLNLRLELVQHIDPLHAPNTILNTYMLEQSESWVAEGKEQKVL
ncbi:MAG TPA: RNA polymerase sigma factor [Saprospiraceae bacterium]|nr:RNA polymerase sigma factor [Saprospiraceae bacterium]